MIIYEDIFREFNKKRIRYIVVGGIAVNLLGVVRSTVDLDVLLDMESTNLLKAVKVLKEKGFRIKQPVDPELVADETIRNDWIKNKGLKALCFYHETQMKQVDFLIATSMNYSKAVQKAEKIKAGRYVIPVISLQDLIKMKKDAGRGVDLEDLRKLMYVKKIKDKK